MKLYYSPGACSLSCHIALEEAGLPFERVRIDLAGEENRKPAYLAVNPLGRVPALDCDGAVLTEAAAILTWIADRVPDRALLPSAGSFERARAMEWLCLLSNTVHIAFRAVFRPARLTDDPTAIDGIRRQGLIGVGEILRALDKRLEGRQYVLGDHFSVCDAYLYVFQRWSWRPVVAPHRPDLPILDAWAERIAQRPAVQRALANEGQG